MSDKVIQNYILYIGTFAMLILFCIYCLFEPLIEKCCYKKCCYKKKNPRQVIPLLTPTTSSPLFSTP